MKRTDLFTKDMVSRVLSNVDAIYPRGSVLVDKKGNVVEKVGGKPVSIHYYKYDAWEIADELGQSPGQPVEVERERYSWPPEAEHLLTSNRAFQKEAERIEKKDLKKQTCERCGKSEKKYNIHWVIYKQVIRREPYTTEYEGKLLCNRCYRKSLKRVEEFLKEDI